MTTDNQIRSSIASFLHLDFHLLKDKDDLIIDLKVDSLDIIRLIVYMENEYHIRYNVMRYNSLTSISSIVKETRKLLEKNE